MQCHQSYWGGIDNYQEEIQYIMWFKERVLGIKNSLILENIKLDEGTPSKTQSSTVVQNNQEELSVLVKGCGIGVPNNIPTNVKKCFTWWFDNGGWKDSKNAHWRYGAQWENEGTKCGFQYANGANYCQNCGPKIQRQLKISK